jgi:hypothetical protein
MVDGRTTMSSESVCQVALSWVKVGSFHTRLFGVVYVTCGDFYDGSEKGIASVRRTGHVHDSKQTLVKTAHIHPATCNLAHWMTRHDSPTIHRCFALPQLLYRWRYQSGKFWIPPRKPNILLQIHVRPSECASYKNVWREIAFCFKYS